MSQLLGRLRKGPATPKPAEPKKPVNEAPEPTPEPKPEPVKVLDASEFKPKSVAPEKTQSLAAMRDIANKSSRTAVQVSDARVKKAKQTMMISGSLTLLAGSFVLLLMSEGFGDLSSILGALGISGGIGLATYIANEKFQLLDYLKEATQQFGKQAKSEKKTDSPQEPTTKANPSK